METCSYCLDEISGGTYIDKEKRFYFCSIECLDEWEKEHVKR